MGGDPEVKKFLSDVIAVEAFKRAGSEEWQKLYKENKYVMIRDYLIFFKGLPVEVPYTLDRLFNHFWRDVKDHLFDPFKNILFYVTVCDDRSNVTKAKEITQSARVEASAKGFKKRGLDEDIQAYPLGTTFAQQGVRLPDGSVEGICLRRLAFSRCYDGTRSNLGNELWHAFLPYIQASMCTMDDAVNDRVFIFDFDKRGPWFCVSGKPCIQRLDLAHDLGEADPAGIWWVDYVATRVRGKGDVDAHLLSSDGDNMPLCLLYDEQKPAHATGKVWWHATPGEVVVDMNKVAEQVLCRFQSPEHFALAFYLAGCDYMFKCYYAYYFNCRAIMDAVARVDLRAIKEAGKKLAREELAVRLAVKAADQAARQEVGELFSYNHEEEEEKEDLFRWVPLFFDKFLLELYFPKIQTVKVAASAAAAKPKSASDYAIDSMRVVCASKKSKTLRFPSDLEVHHQAQMLTWLVEYGTTAKDGKKPKDPEKPCEELLAERMHILSLQTPRAPPKAKAAAAASSSSSSSVSSGNWTASKATGNWQSSQAVANAVRTAAAAAASIPHDTDQALRHKKSKYFMPTAPPTSPSDGFQLPEPAAATISRSVESFLLPRAAVAPPPPSDGPSFGDFDSEIESFN